MKTREQRWEQAMLAEAREALADGKATISIASVTDQLSDWEAERDHYKDIAISFKNYCKDLSQFQGGTPIESVFDAFWDGFRPL